MSSSSSSYIHPVLAVGTEPAKSSNGNGSSTEPEPGKTTLLTSHVLPPDPPDPRLAALTDPTSPRASAFRVLRHHLLKHGDPRVIVVTSPRPGDGKTTLAFNLALVLAEEPESRVLFVDANLARPALALLLGIDELDGILSGAERRVYPSAMLDGTGLHCASLARRQGPELRLSRTLLGAALVDLRNAYDYLVIDAPSVLEGADANTLAELSDAVILAERAGSSKRRDLARALDQLGSVPVLGAVLLDTRGR